MKETALAVFVKTPGLSPVKTRLAATLGTEFAEFFFKSSTEHLKKLLGTLTGELDCYWAVAEEDGLKLWKEFNTLYQGSGGLGERLSSIYSQLAGYKYVFFLGADSPMLTLEEIKQSLLLLKEGSDFVIGPAEDGGFYLFAGSTKVPAKLWMKIPYSEDRTATMLEKALESYGKVSKVKTLLDIDTGEDLKAWIKNEPNHPVVKRIKNEHNIIYTTLSR